MAEQNKFEFSDDFEKKLCLAKKEAERLKICKISSMLFLKVLINSKNSYFYNFLCLTNRINIKNRKRMKRILQKYSKKYSKIDTNKYTIKLKNKVVLYVTEEFFNVLMHSQKFSLKNNPIDEISFIFSLFSEYTKVDVSFDLGELNIDFDLVNRYFAGYIEEQRVKENEFYNHIDLDNDYNNHNDSYNSLFNSYKRTIKMENYLTIIKGDEKILKREDETHKLIITLQKSKKSNAILIGEPGVGKTAILEYLAWKIYNGDCPKELKNKKILSLDVNAIIAGTIYRGQAEERFQKLCEFLEKYPNIILFIDEIHNIIGAGSVNEGSLDLGNCLKPLLARENVTVIGATTSKEYERFFAKDEALKRRFRVIEIKEPKHKDVFEMIKSQVAYLEDYHKVNIDDDMVKETIMLASCFNTQTHNPDKSLDLIDEAMIESKIRNKKSVTKQAVLSIFDANFKIFNEMNNEQKMRIAYHEAGHSIVLKYSRNGNYRDILAISIIPTKDTLGLTVFDDTDRQMLGTDDYQSCIDSIATDLAGRVAEKMYTGTNSAGARGDLQNATQIARNMLMKYGLSTTFSNRNFEDNIDEKSMESLNAEIDKIIDKGFTRATQILNEHKEVLDKLASKLVEKGMISGKEFEEICCNQYAEH